MKENVRRLVMLALLSAVSVVLIYLIRFPIFASAPWLEYDPADIPIMLAAFLFGPWWGLAAAVVACAVQAATVSVQSGIIGFAMHVFATGAYVVMAGLIYKHTKQDFKGTLLALFVALLVAAALMIPLNLIFTPMYGTPIEAVKEMMFPIIVPFNLVKFGINTLVTALLYRSLEAVIKKYRT